MPDFKLKYVIDADGKKAKSELKSVEDHYARLGGVVGESTGISATGLNALAIGAGTAVAGLTAVVAVAAAGTRQLFDLAQSAADYGSEIFDASEKTGLSAEKLSAMKFAADQSGTSLEAVTSGAAKFAKTIGEAGSGSEKAQAKLDRLGVTSNNLDEALKQALATIVKVPPGTQQMTLAMDAFGKTGADLLPFIKSFDGDLEALTERAKELGVTIDDEAARAADEFGDQLDTLSAQFAGVGRTIGQEFIPVFMQAAQFVSNWLAQNKDEVRSWAQDSAGLIFGLAQMYREAAAGMAVLESGSTRMSIVYQGLIGIIENGSPALKVAIYLWDIWANSIDKVIEKGNRARGVMASMGGQLSPFLGGNVPTTVGTRSGGGRSAAASAADQAERKRISNIQKNLQDELRLRVANDRVKAEMYKLQLATEYITAEQNLKAQQTLEMRGLEFKKKAMEDSLSLVQGNADAEERLQRDLKLLEQEIYLVKVQHEIEITELRKKSFKEQIDAAEKQIELEVRLLGERLEKESEINKVIDERNRMLADEAATMAAQSIEGLQYPGSSSGGVGQSIFGGIFGDAAEITDEAEFMKNVYRDLGQVAGDAIGGMADAMGSLVEQWIIYGEVGPNAARKAVAGILAATSREATVRAIMELAYGVAALTPWGAAVYGPAAPHFKAAALFGIVAAATAGAGRAVAGNSFNESRGSRGSSSTSSSQSRDRDQTPISRVSNDAFVSGRNRPGYGPFAELGEAIRDLHSKITSMKPGEVVARGIDQRPGLIGNSYNNDVARNNAIGTRSRQLQGGR